MYNMDKSQKYYDKWKKKLVTKDHILLDFIPMRYPEQANLQTESSLVVA